MIAGRILVVDDEESIREFLSILLEKEGYAVAMADSVADAIERLHNEPFDLVMCDLKLPDGNGLQVLEDARRRRLECPFIIITAHTTPQHALEALRAGAAEYLSKPFNVDDLKIILDKLLSRDDSRPFAVPEFIGSSQPIQRILDLIPRVASTPSTVLITGESGTGKELLARAIHAHSTHADGPFLSVNCGALPEGLLESELFGHARGSFTGAVRDHTGLFQQAHGGTIFLDEVGEMAPSTQVKLLRVLQQREVIPVGATEAIPVDVRLIAATNRDLERDIEEGRFRRDLYYRLNVITLELPPLRERLEDVQLLAEYFLANQAEGDPRGAKKLSSKALDVLQGYHWPGNVRELENVVERAVVLTAGSTIKPEALPGRLREAPPEPLIQDRPPTNPALDVIERAYIEHVLRAEAGNKTRAAEVLGIDPSTLYRKIKRYDLEG